MITLWCKRINEIKLSKQNHVRLINGRYNTFKKFPTHTKEKIFYEKDVQVKAKYF